MRLLVNERLSLLGILPREGDYTTLKIIRDLQESLSFTEEEHKRLNFKQVENPETKSMLVSWDMPEDVELLYAEIPIGKKAETIIHDLLEKMNTEKRLTEQFFSLYEKFCTEEGES